MIEPSLTTRTNSQFTNKVLFSFGILFGELSIEDEFKIHYVLESSRIPDSRIHSNSKYSISPKSTQVQDSRIHPNSEYSISLESTGFTFSESPGFRFYESTQFRSHESTGFRFHKSTEFSFANPLNSASRIHWIQVPRIH